jgi:hypothetical protein
MRFTVQTTPGQVLYIQVGSQPDTSESGSFSYSFTQPAQKIVAAVLPTARSVLENTVATAYASIINTSAATLNACRIVMPAEIPAGFSYQTADSGNNLTGTINNPAFIGAGAVQSFVIAVTPSSHMGSTDIQLVFDCEDTAPAAIVPGLTTFLISPSPVPVPDLVSVSVTPSNDGIVAITAEGTGLFVASTINIGVAGAITATVDDNGRNLPLAVSLCRTNPQTGGCGNPETPGPSSSFTLAANEIGTFSMFVQASQARP